MIFYKGNSIASPIVLLKIFSISLTEKKNSARTKKTCAIMGDTDDNSRDRSLLRESDDPSLSKSGVILHMVRVLKN